MLKSIAVTVAVWLVGLALLTSDGQYFTHGIVVLSAAVLGALPWVPLLQRRHGARQRFAALAVVAVSGVIAVRVSLHLPRAHEEQQRFNAGEGRGVPEVPDVSDAPANPDSRP